MTLPRASALLVPAALVALVTALGSSACVSNSSDTPPPFDAGALDGDLGSSDAAARDAASFDVAVPHDGAPTSDSGPALDAASDALSDASDAGLDAAPSGPNNPPLLLSLVPKSPGLELGWKLMNPCDSIQVERQDQINPYPSQASPPGPPQWPSVAGTATSMLDGTATDTQNSFTYHARCVVGGTPGLWSNEVAHAGSAVVDAGGGG